MSKYLLEEDQKLINNIQFFLEQIENKQVALYALKDEDKLIGKFISMCSESTKIAEIDKFIKNQTHFVVPASNLKHFFKELKEHKDYSEEEVSTLESVRYSENQWILNFKDIQISILEKKLCYYISEKLRRRTAANMMVAFHIIDYCNLNCQMCNKFSPIAKKKYVPSESVIKDAWRLSELTGGQLERIIITGGEPLLHPELEGIVHNVHKAFENTPIQIQTNGLLLKNNDFRLYRLCKDNNAFLWITQYPIDFDYQSTIKSIRNFGGQIKMALDEEKTSWKFPIDINGEQEKFWMFFCWMHGQCINCVDGKIFPCGFIHSSKNFETTFGCHLKRSDRDYIDIYKAENFSDISVFLSDYQPFCANCRIKDWEIDIPWRTSMRSIDEWT